MLLNRTTRESPSPMAVAAKTLRHKAHVVHTTTNAKAKAVAEAELYIAAIRFADAYRAAGGK